MVLAPIALPIESRPGDWLGEIVALGDASYPGRTARIQHLATARARE